jgi:uncharacterized NAD-dependent epimerase/dehydratase family protein
MRAKRVKALRREAVALMEEAGGTLTKQGWRRLKKRWKPGANVKAMVYQLIQEDAHEWLRKEAAKGVSPQTLIRKLQEKFSKLTKREGRKVKAEVVE